MTAGSDALPPHCPEAERGVLGCCLLDPAKMTAPGNQRHKTTEGWELVTKKTGISERGFFNLKKQLVEAEKVVQSKTDEKWERILPRCRNSEL